MVKLSYYDFLLIFFRIQKEHAVLENNENSSVYITASGDSKVLVNGKPVKEKTELHHNDR